MRFAKLLCCFVVLTLIVAATSVLAAGPKIQFEKEVLDFGKVAAGNPINATFKMKNVGDADLEISQVKPGCGCTHAEAKKNKLAPGESSTIEAVFNSAGYADGPINKSITVTSNDPTRHTLTLSIKAEITTLATFKFSKPGSGFNFGDIKVNNSRTYTVRLIPKDPKTFAITKVDSGGTHVSVPSFKKINDKNGAYWQLFVVVKGDKVPGRILETINIHTNAGEGAKVSTTVYGNTIE